MIPHDRFHLGSWLRSTEHPTWYYFSEKRNPNKITNRSFLSSVDGPLRELVEFLHKKNIRTTPSCAGHHIGERHLEKIYSGIEKDACIICDEGLRLEDIETGEIHYCCEKNYVLPWNKEEFVEKLSLYQQKGVIGLHLTNKSKLTQKILELDIEGVSTEKKNSILLIYANGNREGDNRSEWCQTTKEIKRIFK
jgi:hypothetical protein